MFESIYKALHPLLEFTDTLSGEKYVNISPQANSPPSGHIILAKNIDQTMSIKTKVLAYLNDKYSDPYTQSFMDPKLKTQYISTNIPAIRI